MWTRVKPVAVFLAGGLLLVVGSAVVAGAVAFNAGSVRVYVLEKKPGGDHVNLLIPAALVPLGMKFIPDRERERAAARLGPWLPAIEAASRELARVPDGPLVEVESARERVRIAKLGGSLVIDVESEQESVHVSFPLKLVARVARDFETPGLIP